MGVMSQFKGLPRQIFLLSFVRTIMAMGSFVFTFTSLIASDMLGFNEFQTGNVMLFVALAAVGGSLSGGKLADAFGRKRMFLLADFMAVVTILLAGYFCGQIYALIFMIMSFAFTSMATPIIAAMITDYSEERNRTECFSVLYLSQNIGFAIGPSIGGLLFHSYMQWAFYGQGILYGLSALWMLFFVEDRFHETRDRQDKEETLLVLAKARGGSESLMGSLLKRPVVLAFIVCLTALTACYQEISFMMPLQFTEMYGDADGPRFAGFIWTINALICLCGTPLIISASKKNNQLLNIAAAGLLYAVGFAINGMIGQVGLFYLNVIVWTIGEILISTGAGVFIANYAPDTHRARYQSLYEVARGLGRGIGPNLFGYFLLFYTFSQAWYLASAICAVTVLFVVLLYFVERRMKRGDGMREEEEEREEQRLQNVEEG